MKKLNVWFEVLVVLAWGVFTGMGASKLDPGNTAFEIAGAISGLSLGLLVAWGIRFFNVSLRAMRS